MIMDEQAMMGPAHRSTVDELSAKYMVPIRRAVFSCFMLRDGEHIDLLIDSTLAEHACSCRRDAYYDVCDPIQWYTGPNLSAVGEPRWHSQADE